MAAPLGSPAIGNVRALEVREVNGILRRRANASKPWSERSRCCKARPRGPTRRKRHPDAKVQLAQLQAVVNF